MSGPTPKGSGASAAPMIDWSGMFDELSKLGQEVVDRFSKKASENADNIRSSKYGQDELFADIKWFWTNFGTDAARVAEICRTKLPSS